MLDLTRIEAELATTSGARATENLTPPRWRLHHLPTVTSTNTLALEAAQSGTQTGVWIADEQTAGRGRGGHTWHSAPGEGLYLSALIRPHLPLTRALWLSLATGLAARQAIAVTTGLTPDIRWPNDILLNRKKCGGILVETASDPATASQPAQPSATPSSA